MVPPIIPAAAAATNVRDFTGVDRVDLFERWKAEHNRSYVTAMEHTDRFATFTRHVDTMEAHNVAYLENRTTWYMGLNEFSDLTLGEFNEIGETVKEFASDEATVVIGTSLDPDMNNTVRVTVVATGLGRGLQLVQTRPEQTASDSAAAQPMASPDEPDYAQFERPAMHRKAVGADFSDSQEDLDLLDIPAFLRRQAD